MGEPKTGNGSNNGSAPHTHGDGVPHTRGGGAPREARDIALAVASAGLDKKALSVEILDVHGKVDYTDLLVLMTGSGARHVHAIAKGIEEELHRKRGVVPLSVEGMTAARWVLLDFNDVVVHVFQEDARAFYDLEGLWIDASRVAVPDRPPGRVAAPL